MKQRKPEEIQEVLKEHGISTEIVNVCRNGTKRTGFRICTGAKVTPVVYLDPCATEAELLEYVDNALRKRQPAFDTDVLENKQSVLANSIVCVQKISDEPIIKRTLMNLEIYVRICLPDSGWDGQFSIKATHSFIDALGVTESALWEAALNNTAGGLTVREIGEVMASIGFAFPIGPVPMYVAGTKSCLNGAAAILYPDIFGDFCRRNGFGGILILPSSIHELMVIPDSMDASPRDLLGIVSDINEECVLPEEQLTPAVYRYTLETNEVRLVATQTGVNAC